MSRRIAVLPDHLANKIAAGEVIQRPESVVKELLENSLDAGATRIAVVIKEGGKKFIQVSDDGSGMDERDAVTSFLRHATSKIASYEDLEEIRTYGFRGEALASIAAVGQVTMKTRRREDESAVVVRIDGGGTPQISREGREPGSLIAVANLFYNVPARRKFLKSTNTEFRHIHEAIVRTALSHPELALDFVSDDEIVLKLTPATIEERMVDLFGERRGDTLLPVSEAGPLFSLAGFISKPSFGSPSRPMQYLFLNKRFIVSRNINHAVFSAYEHLLTKGTFPFFVLFLDVDPRRVDVNVHPSKMEAKFEDEQSLYRFVSGLVRKTLSDGSSVPSLTLDQDTSAADDTRLRFTGRQHMWPGGSPDSSSWTFPEKVDRTTGEILPGKIGNGLDIVDRLFSGSAGPGTGDVGVDASRGTQEMSGPVWQLHKKYILYPIENGVLILDQHVAHERVLYERAMRRFLSAPADRQQLLFPRTIQLPAGEFALLQELMPHFITLGFEIKNFGKNTIVLEGIPSDVKQQDEGKIVEDILSLYREFQQEAPLDVRENMAKSFACRSAVKAGDPLQEAEMRSLIGQLMTATMPYVCPHGRPVMVRISIDELDRRFGRT